MSCAQIKLVYKVTNIIDFCVNLIRPNTYGITVFFFFKPYEIMFVCVLNFLEPFSRDGAKLNFLAQICTYIVKSPLISKV